MSADAEPTGFLGVMLSPKKGRSLGWFLAENRQAAEKAIADWDEAEEHKSDQRSLAFADPIDADVLVSLAKDDEDKRIIRLLFGFREAMSSARGLIVFSSMSEPILHTAMTMGMLMPFAEKNMTFVEGSEEFKLFSYDGHTYSKFIKELNGFRQIESGVKALPAATLMGMVATFDSYFGDIVKLFLAMYPDRYSNTEKPILFKDIVNFKSVQEIVDFVIDREVTDLMRRSHDDQVDFVEGKLDVKIKDFYERWPDFVEIFERRNLAAHGAMTVNSIYLRNCRANKSEFAEKCQIGDVLVNTSEYLMQANDILTEFGALLIFSLWIKHRPASVDVAFVHLNELSVHLIRDGRHVLASRLLNHSVGLKKAERSDRVHKMMIVNLANAYKKSGKVKECDKLIDKTDWSAAGDSFKFCICALRENVDEFLELMPRVAKDVSSIDFREWPVLDWVRSDERVCAKFEEIYGERLNPDRSSVVKKEEVPEAGAAQGLLSIEEAAPKKEAISAEELEKAS